MASTELIVIDGSFLEGGGQILRMGLAFSAVLNTPLKVIKVRAGRPKPGLSSQHLTGLQVVRETTNARLEGGQIGSTEIVFYPGAITGGKYTADTKTAGSVSLLIQAALPSALYASSPTQMLFRGGTNASWAPQVDYTIHVFRNIIVRFGADFRLFINKRGFYPKGNGEVSLEVTPLQKSLCAADFTDFGEVKSVYGKAFVAGSLPIKVAHKMADAARNLLSQFLPREVEINIDRVKESPDTAFGNGSGIVLWAETSTGCVLGGSALGKQNQPAEENGESAANEILDCVRRKACLDKYTQDQVITLMALASGRSVIRTGPVTDHTRTAIHVAEMMTKVKFQITKTDSDCVFIECEGIGLEPKTVNKQ